MQYHYKIKQGFTLAEVLITLGIIGIVAGITLPALINKYKKQETVTLLKKAYTVISQAIINSEVDNGPMIYWFNNYSVTEGNSEMFGKDALDYIVPYMNGTIIKYAYYSYLDAYGKQVLNLSGAESNGAPASRYYAVTADGMYISANHVNHSNITPFWVVDVNGRKGPNTYGKDVFYFMITGKNRLVGYNFYGWNREQILEKSCNKTSSGQNRACAALIMMDGWEIKDDYPW